MTMTLTDTFIKDEDTPTVNNLTRALHNPYAVRAWLEKKRPDEVAGQAGSPMRCTLHNFLADTTGKQVSVSPTTFRVRGNWQEIHQMPAWAQRFVIYHDTANGRGKAAVTAGQALRALARAVDPPTPIRQRSECSERPHPPRG
jgi:hypothetical protein